MRDVLFDRQTIARGYFKRESIEGLIAENARSGRYPKELLSLIVLELWHRSFLTGNCPATADVAEKPALALGD